MFKRDFLPSMGVLMAFECAARHGSISRAAEELHLTQSAVSRQIKQLEDQVGTVLFHRVRQRVVLTDAGRVYAAELRGAMESVSQATQKVMTLGGVGEVLNLAVLPMFATRWLIPRMSRFVARFPKVIVNYASKTEPFDFHREPFDAAIHYGEDFWPEASCTYLLAESVLPVCSPEFKRRHRIRTKADLPGETLLQQSTRPTQWAEWFDQVGVSTSAAMRGPRYEQFSMLVQAAASGHGVALVPRFLVEEELQSERLVLLSHEVLVTQQAYYVVLPDAGSQNPLALAFRDWLVQEAKAVQPRSTHR
ncbi:LysR family transcriptional regulator, glycine cleavage system transcriptional activator [Variovorax sp. HW608]|uniref:transcriptional regulator GcvA n=1 Tax=Variovorax sp. HW608 TaxID=1034889 RepID=UPI00081FCB3B|nr:transcriptional regulator GcvA [Variovorax sp. HW608]SCK23030.1 LysR family transcriptional regulator, glycine cleavage system transcriptional activator [Variovorax sp. HW608]